MTLATAPGTVVCSRLAAFASILLAVGVCLPAAAQAPERWLWAEQSTGLDNEVSQAVATGPAGEIYVAGQFWGEATFGTTTLSHTSGSYSDGFLAKYSADGTALWARHLPSTREVDVRTLAVDGVGNVYAAGRFWGTATVGGVTLTAPAISVGDVFLAKYDAEGVLVWVRQAGGTVGSYAHHANGLALGPDGALYLTGGFRENVAFGPHVLQSAGGTDLFLVRVSPDGVFEWARRGGGTGGDSGNAVAVDAAGAVYVAGSFRSTAAFGDTTLVSGGAADALLVRYGADGTVVWARQGADTFDAFGLSVAVMPDDDVVLGGSFARRLDFGGTVLQAPNNFEDGFVVRFDAAGAPVWARRIGGTNSDAVASLAVDATGRTFVTGTFIGPATFGGAAMAGYGGPELYVGAFASDGTPAWVDVASGTQPSAGHAVAHDPAHGLVLTGGFVGSLTLGEHTLVNSGAAARRDMVLARYGGGGTVAADPGLPSAEAFVLGPLAPHPASDRATATLTLGRAAAVEVAVYDALGRRVAVVQSGWLAEGVHALAFDASTLPAGAYVMRAVGGAAAAARSFVVAR